MIMEKRPNNHISKTYIIGVEPKVKLAGNIPTEGKF